MMAEGTKQRCSWVGNDPLMVKYHDREWGRPEKSSTALFEKLLLDGFQAGLSWRTILHRREGMRDALWKFEVNKLASLSETHLMELRQDCRLIRHPQKIAAIRTNAQAYIRHFSSRDFSKWIWSFAPPKRLVPLESPRHVPTQTEESRQMSKSLKSLGFVFCGPIICYAFMQATGLVDDHTATCFLAKQKKRG